MATKKSPIQLRFDGEREGEKLWFTVRLVERQADETFRELDKRTVDVATHPASIRDNAIFSGYADACGARVAGEKDGRQKFSTIVDHILPRMAEGHWSDGRGASVEERALAAVLNWKIKEARDFHREEEEKFQTAISHPVVVEKIQQLKAAESSGGLNLSDLGVE